MFCGGACVRAPVGDGVVRVCAHLWVLGGGVCGVCGGMHAGACVQVWEPACCDERVGCVCVCVYGVLGGVRMWGERVHQAGWGVSWCQRTLMALRCLLSASLWGPSLTRCEDERLVRPRGAAHVEAAAALSGESASGNAPAHSPVLSVPPALSKQLWGGFGPRYKELREVHRWGRDLEPSWPRTPLAV